MIAGRAPILDFDGTLARVELDWEAWRRRFGVRHIADLWRAPGGAREWAALTAAEVEAAAIAEPVLPVLALLEGAPRFAVLSNNSARAVDAFLSRFPSLRPRAAIVVGREMLGGPKSDFQVFERGYRTCAEALEPIHGKVYIGDQAYELDFAARLGAAVIDVKTLDGS